MEFIILNRSSSQIQERALRLLVLHLIHYSYANDGILRFRNWEPFKGTVIKRNPEVGSLRREWLEEEGKKNPKTHAKT